MEVQKDFRDLLELFNKHKVVEYVPTLEHGNEVNL